ncbi:dGTPase [Caldanaerobius fijiensis DSM 17918]|uniref:Deoxyguanosinetriphosphate triphosphohydrolase-like protein n=1 Tax=Caldanaerobius fijiensis DSM 17918 TaxID=1121256 RepID=A0A1M4SD97_9THEO|nr:deoxyguanosinetriphosphate triphosphohydrolase [Caldanaerobius fijiensis]SHE29997.1 dGTPase [Caldanaerobius fijiensis DSM 17918]
MNIRERTEEIESMILSPYAVLSSKTKGRLKDEPKCDIRTEFQRDRDRIIHSKAFRRLKHKTQVFISPLGDHYRTRLTHTLEVAQIARTIARGLRLNEDLTEAIALGHDLGHTPFGHAGEAVLNEIMPDGFRHNEQSLRVVDILEREGGLNLTWEVRDGILNHTRKNTPATLEGKIIQWADRIAYINHDIDDAIRAGILDVNDLPWETTHILGLTHSERINNIVVDIINNSIDKDDIIVSETIRHALDVSWNYMYNNIYVGSEPKKEEEKAKNLLRELFFYFEKRPELMPPEYIDLIDRYSLKRAVCDYIAGMTDQYAIQMFRKIFIPDSWKK